MNIYALTGIRTRDPSNQEAASNLLRQHGYQYRLHVELVHLYC